MENIDNNTTDISNQEIIEKIINVLFLSGEEIDIDKISRIISVDKNILVTLMPIVGERLSGIGLFLLQNNNKYIIVSNNKYSDILRDFTEIEYSGDLTPAALQTITIISYLGESSENDIAFIRGIQSTQIIRNLATRGLIEKNIDNKYRLTAKAFQILGITDISQLPEKDELSEKIKLKLQDNLVI